MATSVTTHDDEWDGPLCLVDNSKAGEFKVIEETLEELRKVHHPVVVVSIVGPYRSGKSYLMNRLAGYKKGFEIGSSVQAKTKGIWVWCMKHPERADQRLLLLDTEGLGDVEKIKGTKNDITLFLLTTLFSSCLIYNSRGTIDQQAIDNLSFVLEIAEKFTIKSDSKSAEDDDDAILGQYFPHFIWVVRDFVLELKVDGDDITADQYLENSLVLKKGSNRSANEYNEVRRCIRRYFPDRKCFVLPLPVMNTESLKRLPELTAPDLAIPFLQQVKQLTDHVNTAVQPKSIGGIVIDGPKFISLVRNYTYKLAAGEIPSIETVMLNTAAEVNKAVVDDCITSYRSTMSSVTSQSYEDLMTKHKDCVTKIKDELKKRGINLDGGEDQQVVKELMDSINKEYDVVKARLEEESMQRSRDLLTKRMTDIQRKIESSFYLKPGGYTQYQQDFGQACTSYLSDPNKGLMAMRALHECVEKFSADAKTIMTVDSALTGEKKKQEEQKVKEEQEQRARELERKKQEEIERRWAEQASRQEELLSTMKELLREQTRRHGEEMRRLELQLVRERDRLRGEGAKEDSQSYDELLTSLHRGRGQQQQPRSPIGKPGTKKPLYFIH